MRITFDNSDEAWFWAHAGYSYPKGAPAHVVRQHRVDNARRLAAAERWLAGRPDLELSWHRSTDPDYRDVDPQHVDYVADAFIVDRAGNVVASIAEVMFGFDDESNERHRRLIEAQLALEALGTRATTRRSTMAAIAPNPIPKKDSVQSLLRSIRHIDPAAKAFAMGSGVRVLGKQSWLSLWWDDTGAKPGWVWSLHLGPSVGARVTSGRVTGDAELRELLLLPGTEVMGPRGRGVIRSFDRHGSAKVIWESGHSTTEPRMALRAAAARPPLRSKVARLSNALL